MSFIYWLNLVVLGFALVLSVSALYRGPGALNRCVALDMLTAITIAMACLVTVWQDRDDTIPILIALTLVSFLTSTSVARVVGQRQWVSTQDQPDYPEFGPERDSEDEEGGIFNHAKSVGDTNEASKDNGASNCSDPNQIHDAKPNSNAEVQPAESTKEHR